MPAPTFSLPKAPRLNGVHIGQLLASRTSALIQHEDGTWHVAYDLDGLADTDVVVRQYGWRWADELLSAAEDEAAELDKPTARRSVLAAAGREATAELAAEYALEASLYATTPAIPMPRPTTEDNR